MHINIWIGKEYLEVLNKNINSPMISEQDVWEHTVEYTDVVVMEGQVQVSIKYDKYIELTDKGLLLLWEPNMG